MRYWPAYSTISPSARSAYLEWLEGGRSDPGACVGYVFLYYYGLERRVLHDAKDSAAAKDEIPLIQEEIRRLLSVYSENRSFLGYASRLLGYLAVADKGWQPAQEPPPQGLVRREFDLGFQAAVGHMSAREKPLPPVWALAWAKRDPRISLRMPARRCESEFDDLFLTLYERQYGEGLRIRPCRKTVSAAYWPASASFAGSFALDTSYPDVTSLVGPGRKIEELVQSCCELLDPYSRWLGRRSNNRDSLPSAGLLPAELIETRAPRAFFDMRDELGRRVIDPDGTVLPARAVFRHWFGEEKERLTKKDTVEAAQVFGKAGFGFEPDVRFQGPSLSRQDKVVLFRFGDRRMDAPSSDYSAATALLRLASLVAATDGEISREEREHLRDHLAEGLRLGRAERRRLKAHLEWLLAQPPTTPGGKRRLGSIPADERQSVAEFLVAVAWADGRLEPAEVKMLTRVFRLLGLDSAIVHRWLHDYQTAADLGPVTVSTGVAPQGYELPEGEDSGAQPRRPGVQLDAALVAEKIRSSERAASRLAHIFADPEATEVFQDAPPAPSSDVLDGAYVRLLQQLSSREAWSRSAYDEISESLGLMPDGALDVLNEVAFEVCDEPLLEGTDTLEVNSDVAKEMLS